MLSLNITRNPQQSSTININYKPLNLNVIATEQQPKKRITRYTFPIFLERALNIHGNKIDFFSH